LKEKIGEVKDSTINSYEHRRGIFFKTFSEKEAIATITENRLREWKTALLIEHAAASVAGYLQTARMVFRWAVTKKWLDENPVDPIPIGSFVNRKNDRTISMAEYAKMLDVCPNQEWRTIIALARIGGLRCPSELKRLQWTDINWAENRFWYVRRKQSDTKIIVNGSCLCFPHCWLS
jgi:integrase